MVDNSLEDSSELIILFQEPIDGRHIILEWFFEIKNLRNFEVKILIFS